MSKEAMEKLKVLDLNRLSEKAYELLAYIKGNDWDEATKRDRALGVLDEMNVLVKK